MHALLQLVTFLLFSAPHLAFAFCGFYVAGGDAKLFNDATQVALVRDGTKTVLSMQNSYQGPPEAFAMVVPVPQVLNEAQVKTLDKEVFDRLDKLTAPRLVEYWEENPCERTRWALLDLLAPYESAAPLTDIDAASNEFRFGVEVESKFVVGEYDIVVLSANDATGLDGYLRAEKYNIPKGAEPYLRPYVEQGSYFFVAKVDPKRAKFQDGRAVLSPLRFEYESATFQLPIRLGMINSQGKQDLIIYTIGHDKRYEVANYPSAYIPTNIEVDDSVKEEFGEFYQALFAATLAKNPKAIVTEYAWQFSNCDPCPEEPLGGTEMLALGMIDVADAKAAGMALGQWTITRLHARYAPDDIGEDLVFRQAPNLYGGREQRGEGGALEATNVKGQGPSQFQGRYIMRNRWFGPITCVLPEFGRWGGPEDRWKAPAPRFLESPNTRGLRPPDVTNDVTRWLEQGVEELGTSGSRPKPFSFDWFTFILGYGLTLIITIPLLFGLRAVRKRWRAAHYVGSVLLGLGCCVSMVAGDLTLIIWAVGMFLINLEDRKLRRQKKEIEGATVP